MNQAQRQKVFVILTRVITVKPIDWKDMMVAVSAEMTVKNWLDVRGVLQWMLNQNLIERLPSVYVEQYQTVGARP